MRAPEWLTSLDVPELELTTRERRTVAVGAVLALAIVLSWHFTRPAPPSVAEAVDSRPELHARLRGLADQREEVDRAWQRARRRRAELRRRLVPGGEPSRAGVALSRLVEGMAERSGVELERTSVGDPRPLGGGLAAVSVDVDAAADVYGLGELLGELETAGPTLSARSLRITSSAGTSLAGPSGDRAPLRIQLSVVGYALSADSVDAEGDDAAPDGGGARADSTAGPAGRGAAPARREPGAAP